MDQNLLYKYFQGKATEEEERLIIEWTDADQDNMEKLLEERRFYDIALFLDSDEEVKPARKKIFTMVAKWSIGVAASIIVVLSCGLLWKDYQYNNMVFEMQSVSVPPGQRAQITLADGTTVWLNAQSTLKYNKDFGVKNRDVQLDGEAYFDVAHDKKLPFYVNTEMNRIGVVGTKFNVCSYNGTDFFEAALVEGVIDIYEANGVRPLLRMQKDEIFYAASGKYKRTKMHSDDFLRWTEGLYCFDDTPLADVFSRLEKYYSVEFVVNNPSVLNYNCTGKFKEQDGIEHILRTIRRDHKFNYRIVDEGSKIIIE